MNEKLKKWIDDISEAFGGLDMCSIEAVLAKDNREHIIEVGQLKCFSPLLYFHFLRFVVLLLYYLANRKRKIGSSLPT